MSLATLARKTKTKQRIRTRGKFILNMTGRGNVLGMNAKMSRGNCKGLTKCAGKRAGCCVGVGGESDCCRFPHGGKPAPQMGYRVYLNRKSNGAYQPSGGKQCTDISGCINTKTVLKKSYDTSASEITQKKKEECLWFYNKFGKRCAVKEGCHGNICCNKQNNISGCDVKKSFSNKSTDLVRYTRMNVSCGITKSLPYNQAGHQITKIKSLSDCRCTFSSTISTGFTGSQNRIFNMAKSHNVAIVNSGTGIDEEDDWSGKKIGDSVGGEYLGFKSNSGQYPTSSYLALSLTNNPYPQPIVSALANKPAHKAFSNTILTVSNAMGRYVQSDNLYEMNVHKDVSNKRLKITSWDQLEEMTVVWIAGNNLNGGDRPDTKKFNDNIPQESDAFRVAENLAIDFHDNNNNCIGNELVLWATKREPTVEEYITAYAQNISPFNAVFGKITQTYVGHQFTTTVIKKAAFGNLKKASFFTIGQPRQTGTSDNYGIKYVSLKFKYQI